MIMDNRPWIGVDLDGTLAEYHGWSGEDVIGVPIYPMIEKVQKKIRQGYRIKIMTARVCHMGHTIERIKINRRIIKDWCLNNIGMELEVTSEKDCLMAELWDDLVKQVIPNTGIFYEEKYK
jgi:hypothetical protein